MTADRGLPYRIYLAGPMVFHPDPEPVFHRMGWTVSRRSTTRLVWRDWRRTGICWNESQRPTSN